MKKIINWFSLYVAGCNSATRIRAAFKLHTVKNTLTAINFAIIVFGACAILAGIFPQLLGKAQMAGCVLYTLSTLWLCGLRVAVADSQQSREAYIRNSKRVCKNLGDAIIIAIGVAFSLLFVAVAVATAVEMGTFESLIQVYPGLKELSSIIVEYVSAVIEAILVQVR